MKKAIAKFKGLIKAWSFSRWKDYTRCPLYAKLKHVERRKEPDHPAGARGQMAHQQADQFVSGATHTPPADFKKFKTQLTALRKAKVQCEQEWAFDSQWQRVGWFDSAAWLRVKVDTHWLSVEKLRGGARQTTVCVVDYKTGKQHEEHTQQRELYAIGAMLVYPDAVAVVVQHWYLDSGEVDEDRFVSDQLEQLQQTWLQRTQAMLNDTRFAPRPGNYCRFCHFRKSNGGPCRY